MTYNTAQIRDRELAHRQALEERLDEIRNDPDSDPEVTRIEDELDKLPDPIPEFLTFAVDKTQKELGALVIETIAEATHSGWEGYTPADLVGVRKFLDDLMVCHRVVTRDDPTHYQDLNYFTGSHYLTKDMGPK